jgi:hypothetical protein
MDSIVKVDVATYNTIANLVLSALLIFATLWIGWVRNVEKYRWVIGESDSVVIDQIKTWRDACKTYWKWKDSKYAKTSILGMSLFVLVILEYAPTIHTSGITPVFTKKRGSFQRYDDVNMQTNGSRCISDVLRFKAWNAVQQPNPMIDPECWTLSNEALAVGPDKHLWTKRGHGYRLPIRVERIQSNLRIKDDAFDSYQFRVADIQEVEITSTSKDFNQCSDIQLLQTRGALATGVENCVTSTVVERKENIRNNYVLTDFSMRVDGIDFRGHNTIIEEVEGISQVIPVIVDDAYAVVNNFINPEIGIANWVDAQTVAKHNLRVYTTTMQIQDDGMAQDEYSIALPEPTSIGHKTSFHGFIKNIARVSSNTRPSNTKSLPRYITMTFPCEEIQIGQNASLFCTINPEVAQAATWNIETDKASQVDRLRDVTIDPVLHMRFSTFGAQNAFNERKIAERIELAVLASLYMQATEALTMQREEPIVYTKVGVQAIIVYILIIAAILMMMVHMVYIQVALRLATHDKSIPKMFIPDTATEWLLRGAREVLGTKGNCADELDEEEKAYRFGITKLDGTQEREQHLGFTIENSRYIKGSILRSSRAPSTLGSLGGDPADPLRSYIDEQYRVVNVHSTSMGKARAAERLQMELERRGVEDNIQKLRAMAYDALKTELNSTELPVGVFEQTIKGSRCGHVVQTIGNRCVGVVTMCGKTNNRCVEPEPEVELQRTQYCERHVLEASAFLTKIGATITMLNEFLESQVGNRAWKIILKNLSSMSMFELGVWMYWEIQALMLRQHAGKRRVRFRLDGEEAESTLEGYVFGPLSFHTVCQKYQRSMGDNTIVDEEFKGLYEIFKDFYVYLLNKNEFGKMLQLSGSQVELFRDCVQDLDTWYTQINSYEEFVKMLRSMELKRDPIEALRSVFVDGAQVMCNSEFKVNEQLAEVLTYYKSHTIVRHHQMMQSLDAVQNAGFQSQYSEVVVNMIASMQNCIVSSTTSGIECKPRFIVAEPPEPVMIGGSVGTKLDNATGMFEKCGWSVETESIGMEGHVYGSNNQPSAIQVSSQTTRSVARSGTNSPSIPIPNKDGQANDDQGTEHSKKRDGSRQPVEGASGSSVGNEALRWNPIAANPVSIQNKAAGVVGSDKVSIAHESKQTSDGVADPRADKFKCGTKENETESNRSRISNQAMERQLPPESHMDDRDRCESALEFICFGVGL